MKWSPSQKAPSRGARGVIAAEALLVRTLPDARTLIVLADQLGGDGEQLKAIDIELRRLVRLRKLPIGVAPGLTLERLAAPLDRFI